MPQSSPLTPSVQAVTFSCPEPHRPTAWMRAPVIVGDRAHASVVEISVDGVVLSPVGGSWPADGELTVVLPVPFGASHEVSGHLKPNVDGTVALIWSQPPPELLTDLATYLLLTTDVTPERLRAAGLGLRSAMPAVRFEEVRGLAGIEEFLDLRLRTHQHDGHLVGLSTADLASPFDEHSWQVVARHRGRLVLCSRLILVEGDPSRSQYVAWSGHEVPQRLWDEGFVEIGAGAIEPEYQHAGLYVPMMQHLTRIAARSGAPHVLAGVPVDHLPRYEAMGYDLLETREVEPRPGWRFPAHLLGLDLPALLAGRRDGKLVPAMRDAALAGLAEV